MSQNILPGMLAALSTTFISARLSNQLCLLFVSLAFLPLDYQVKNNILLKKFILLFGLIILIIFLQVFVQSPSSVKVYGPGVKPGVKTNQPTHFVVDCKEAGPGKRTRFIYYKHFVSWFIHIHIILNLSTVQLLHLLEIGESPNPILCNL